MKFHLAFPLFLLITLTGLWGHLQSSFEVESYRTPAAEEQLLSFEEFKDLASEMAKRVNLFQEVWKQDPEAEFFGGTSRDYLYWLKSKLAVAKNRQELDQIIEKLRSLPVVDVRDFIIGESDVDIVSKNSIMAPAEQYGVKSIDIISPERFDLATQAGRDELKQGFIPIEKIRLGSEGFVPNTNFGDGVSEIFTGRLSLNLASESDFASTRFAKLKLNHPILLALRYLRLTAMHYAAEHGRGFPDKEVLREIMGEHAEDVKRIIADAIKGRSLKEHLSNEKFSEWINGTIKKGYRSYTNPTATKLLHEEFNVSGLADSYFEIEPIKPYLFAHYRDQDLISSNLDKYNIQPNHFFGKVDDFFPNGLGYHGTGLESAFKGILYQGVMPSSSGVGGEGLYMVAEKDIKFAIDWGGSKDRVVQFPISKDAKIVDISKPGPAQKLFKKLKVNEEKFCEMFGIDILKYEYSLTDAYVVKNSAVLGQANGTYRQIKSLGKLLDDAAKVNDYDKLKDFIETGKSNRLTSNEWKLSFQSMEGNFDKESFFDKLMQEKEFEKASRLLHAYEVDDQFEKIKAIMDASFANYQEKGYGLIIDNSYYHNKSLLQASFPDKMEWFQNYYTDYWKAFIKKAYAWEGDQWEFNESDQINRIIRENLSFRRLGEDRVNQSRAYVQELVELYKEIAGDEKLDPSHHLYDYVMTNLRKMYLPDKQASIARPMMEMLEQNLYTGGTSFSSHRIIKELAEFYASAGTLPGEEVEKSLGLRILIRKYYENFSGDILKDNITKDLSAVIRNDYADNPYVARTFQENVQALYLAKLSKDNDLQSNYRILETLEEITKISQGQQDLKDLAKDLKKQGYPKEIVQKAKSFGRGNSFKENCFNLIKKVIGK